MNLDYVVSSEYMCMYWVTSYYT